jgi:bifunctional non-homologous end joining protein LigD
MSRSVSLSASKRTSSGEAAQGNRRLRGPKCPLFIPPQLAVLSKKLPAQGNWIFEDKYDGYRILARIDGKDVKLYSRNQIDWTERFKTVAQALKSKHQLYLDGEVVAYSGKGRHSFQTLQNYFRQNDLGLKKDSERKIDLRYYVFDILWINGHDCRPLPLTARKELLQSALADGLEADPLIEFSKYRTKGAAAWLKQICARGGEGIICKQVDAPYLSVRSPSWLKIKCTGSDEFVIGGFTKLKDNSNLVGALLLGQYDKGALVYSGKVGTGFSTALRRDLYRKLISIARDKSPFTNLSRSKTAIWVNPKIIVQVEFTERTHDGLLRHPSLQGLREDKSPSEVRYERPS